MKENISLWQDSVSKNNINHFTFKITLENPDSWKVPLHSPSFNFEGRGILSNHAEKP